MKLTQEEASKRFSDIGFELLGEYQGRRKVVRYRCSCGEILEKKFKNVIECGRCCCNKKIRLSQKQASERLTSVGFEMLGEYNGSSSLIEYKCKCGKIVEKVFNWAMKGRCSCQRTQEGVAQCFADAGCELLSEYKNSREKVEYRCGGCGEIRKIRVSNFKLGVRCKECGIKRIADLERYSQEYVENFFREQGCELLSEYDDCHAKIKYRCNCGDIADGTWNSFRRGCRCRLCGNKKTAEKIRHNIDFIKSYFAERGCEFLDETYIDNSIPVKYRCVCGNIAKICFSSFKAGNRCRKCGNKKISGENSCNWIKDREHYEMTRCFRKRCNTMVRSVLGATGGKKISKCADLLGYNCHQLRDHFMSHPNWENVKNGKWNIDHIFPIKAFIDYKIYDIKLINCLENLQPLTQFDNFSKNDKYNRDEFEKWLLEKGVDVNDAV